MAKNITRSVTSELSPQYTVQHPSQLSRRTAETGWCWKG